MGGLGLYPTPSVEINQKEVSLSPFMVIIITK
jgi:hypothetical protein